MTSYFIRRFLLIIPTFIGITLMVFAVTRFVPGGPIERVILETQLAQEGQAGMQPQQTGLGGGTLSDDQIQQLKEYYGFDKPIFISYLHWMGNLTRLDLGRSTRYNEPVWSTIIERLPVSFFYGLATLIITYGVCIPLGIVKAIRHNTIIDHSTSVVVFVGYAVPGFVVGIGLLVLFASVWHVFPLSGFVSDSFDDLTFFGKVTDLLYHAVLPLAAYLASSFAVMTFMMKNALMENLAADYLRTAMAKGLPFRKAVFHHALRNSLIPIATTFGQNISFFLTGSFLIEKVFNIDGFGLLGYESLVERDYPVVMGILAISSVLFLLGNILSDFCVALVDPRVKFEGK
jgi:microcin C transport system permease protein